MDMQTVLTSYFVSALICAAVVASLWRQNHKHFDGLGFWLADYVLQFIALPLVLLQGYLPDFVSMTIGNGLGVTGALLLYIGLERFVGKRSRQFHNYVILAAFLVIHTWFIFGDPSLTARKVNVSAALIVLIAQSAWLMFRRVDAELRPITRGAGVVFVTSIAVNLIRIYVDLTISPGSEDLFDANLYDSALFMSYQMLLIGLTFSLFAMVNRRLSMNLQDDIDNRKRAEDALKQSEQLYRQMFLEHSAVRLLVDPLSGSIVQANSAAAQFYGYTVEELQAMNITQINVLPPDAINEAMQKALHRTTGYFTFQHLLASGEVRDVEVHSSPIKVGGRELLYSVIHDISERKRAEEALVRSQQMYQDLVEGQSIGVYRIRVQKYFLWGEPEQPHYEYEFVNDEYCRLTGASREEHFADPALTLKLIHPEDYPSFAKKNEEADITNEPFAWEGRMIIHGEIRWMHYESRSRRFPDIGEVWTGILMDITERKQAEAALRTSREMLALFINQSPIYAYIKEVTPTQSRVIYASENYVDMIGIPGSGMVGKTMEELFPAEFAAKITADDWAVVSGKDVLNQEEELNGRQYITIKFPLLRTGMVNLLAGYTIDITERKQAEAALRESEKRFRQLISSAPDVVFLVNQEGKIVFANVEATNLLGYTPVEFIGMAVENLIPQQLRERHIANRAAYMGNPRTRLMGAQANLFAIHKDGNQVPVDIKLSPVNMEEEIYIVTFMRDVTERKNTEKELIKAKEEAEEGETRFRKSLEFSPTPMAVADHTGALIFLNKNFIDTYGYTLQDIPTINHWMMQAYPDPEYRKSCLQLWGQDSEYAIKNNTATPLREYQVTCKSGEVKNVAILAFFEKDLIIGHFLDISDRVRAEGELLTSNETLKTQLNEISMLKDALQKQAIHDPLTNLHNRRYLNEMLEHEVARAARENYPIGIMLIDIDRFKGFNDTYGHSAGDEMLISLSRLLLDNIREGDVACRYGGEEFLVVMIGAHEEDVKRRAEEICQNFSRLQIRFGKQELSTTVSIGIAFYPKHGTEIQIVIDAADAAMYQAKEAGRNRVQAWQAGM